jgi:hypothetical protein
VAELTHPIGRGRVIFLTQLNEGPLTKALSTPLLALLLAWSPTMVQSGGNCLLHPEPFRLQSDTVHWSMMIISGAECIQGLRWSTLMIDNISIIDQPKLGRLSLQGPSFRYFSNAGAHGNDSFKLRVAGTSLRLNGASVIEVDVAVH